MSTVTAYRRHNWFDSKRRVPVFGIQGKFSGQWLHCFEGQSALLFDTEEERDTKLKALRKELRKTKV